MAVPMPVAGLAVVLGALVAGYGWRSGVTARALSNTPVSDVEALTEPGPVALHGVARKPDFTGNRAPFSARSYLVAGWTVEEWRESDSGSRWSTLATGHEAVPFVLEDDTGTVAIDFSEDADVTVDPDRMRERHEVAPDDSPPRAVKVFETKTDGIPEQRGSNLNVLDTERRDGTRRYSEGLVTPDEEVYVLGTAERRDGDLVVTGDGPAVVSTAAPEAVDAGGGPWRLYVLLGVALVVAGLSAIPANWFLVG
ncbi:GIDE domain-containing protein [Halorubellus litoreus]|uniref:RING-type E3 ubiquitin transferase n=1 Tax=Halorubellus litoreus TaxID=755308 RepID=A0ABD5VI51_9EURY